MPSCYFVSHDLKLPIPEAARSKVCVCGLSLSGIAGSNPPSKKICVSLVSVVCCQRSLRWADHSSRGALSNVLCPESDREA